MALRLACVDVADAALVVERGGRLDRDGDVEDLDHAAHDHVLVVAVLNGWGLPFAFDFGLLLVNVELLLTLVAAVALAVELDVVAHEL